MTLNTQAPDTAHGLAQIIGRIPQNTRVESIKDINATIQLRSLGDDPGEWILTINGGTCVVEQGRAPSANLTIEAAASVWSNLVQRKLDPVWAYMSGQLSVSGDLSLAMRLQQILAL